MSKYLKPCWKCGGEAFQWKNKIINTGLVTCKNGECMPIDENYTFDEWQNHPRPEPSAMSELASNQVTKATMEAAYDYLKVIKDSSMSELGNLPNYSSSHMVDAVRYATLMANKLGVDTSNYWYCDYAFDSKKRGDKFNQPAPQKLTWIQKIRGYDDLQARCNSAEAMRDHYKESLDSWESVAISKARELELMEKVADNWQQRLICVQKDYADVTEMIGRRLKFSVGHNHVEIIIGNPVTACWFTEFDKGDDCYVDRFLDVSICHKNDQFDWKRGVVESLENMISNWLGSTYGDKQDYYNALFTAYPEIGIQPVVKPVKKTKKAKK